MSEADILYVPELAKKLGRTEKAIRSGLAKAKRTQVEWLPPAFKFGDKWAWKRADVDRFIDEMAQKGGE